MANSHTPKVRKPKKPSQSEGYTSVQKTAPDSRDSVLGLQDAAGNQATSQMVAEENIPISKPNDPHEHEANRIADQAVQTPNSAEYSMDETGDGQSLPEQDRVHFEAQLGADLSGVRLHTDGQAAQLADDFDARAFVIGQDMVFGAGEYQPHTRGGRHLLAHELAHVSQQQHGEATGIQRVPKNTLTDFDEKKRKRLKVITTQVKIDDLDGLFSTKVAKTTIPVPKGVSVQFASGIDKKVQHGLSNVGGKIIQSGTLHTNSTITLALDLKPYGGENRAYRYTLVKQGKNTQELLIEQLDKVGPTLPPAQKKEAVDRKSKLKIKFTGIWSTDDKEKLWAAIACVPESALSNLNGLTFNRIAGINVDDPDEGGHYDMDTHTVDLYDRAFQDSLTRYGGDSTPVTDDSVRAIVHEIGHVIDRAPLRKADDEARNQILPKKGVKAASAHLNKARSPSGMRWKKIKGTWELVTIGKKEAKKHAFRAALTKDGGIDVSKYAETDWEESYAEAFSFYVTDPDRLKAIRPNVYAYFSKQMPR